MNLTSTGRLVCCSVVLGLVLLRGAPEARGADASADTAWAPEFFSTLILAGQDLQQQPHLAARPGLRRVAEQAARGAWAPALAAFHDYYMDKLARLPDVLGMPADLADPAINFNGAFPAMVTTNAAARQKTIDAANALLAIQPDHTPNSHNFANALAQAFIYTRDERYLRQWDLLMNAWARQVDPLEQVRPVYMTPGDAKGAPGAFQHLRLLRALAQVPAEERTALRPETLARMLAKLVRVYPLTTSLYHESNPRNWINESSYMISWVGAACDEFRSGALLADKGRGMFERYGTTHVLPDGTEVQRLFGYNFMYVGDGTRHVRLLDTLYPDRAQAPESRHALDRERWADEQRAQLRDRTRYLIRMSTPDRGLPLGIRGDYRQADFGGLRAMMPNVVAEPDTEAIIAALSGKVPGPALPPASDVFPWGGYFWQRAGWGPGHAHAFLVNNPLMGDNGFMGRSANNAFGLNAHGMDMLEIGVDGVYSIRPSPLLVDGRPQNNNAGIFLTDNEPVAPLPWRWHTSASFDLAEAVYAGPYARADRPETAPEIAQLYRDAIKDVSHQRQLIFLKEAGLWLVVDRLRAERPRDYTLVWRLPGPPASKPNVRTFDPAAIRVDAAQEAVHTEADGQPNLSLYHAGIAPLDIGTKAPRNRRPAKLTVLTDVPVKWKGRGEDVVATLVHPRPDRATKLADVRRATGTEAVGFAFTAPKGLLVETLAARGAAADLKTPLVAARAELLLVQRGSNRVAGLVLGCESLSLNGRAASVPQPDFSFEVVNGRLTTTPLLAPVMPVKVLPAIRGFAGAQTITLTCETPGVELRYTLDGSEPTPASTRYDGPFTIEDTTTVRARAYRPGLTENPPELNGRRASPPVWAFYEKLEPIPAAAPAGGEPGLRAERYDRHWLDMLHGLDRLAPVEARVVSALFEKWDGVPAPESFRATPGVYPTPAEQAPPPYGLRYSGFIDVPADGAYTFHAPDHFMRDNLAAGYELVVRVADRRWRPAMQRHGFGTWTVALQKGLHPFSVEYVDYRGSAVADYYHPDLRVNWIWPGAQPPLLLSGPGLEPQPIPVAWLKRSTTP